MEEKEEGVSPEMLRILDFISDPKNAHLFTVEAAREAFKHVKIDDEVENKIPID